MMELLLTEEFFTKNALIIFAIAIPLFGMLLLPLFAHSPNLRESITFATGFTLVFIIYQLTEFYFAGGRPELDLWQIAPGFTLSFALRPLGIVFGLIASSLWVVSTLYSIGYMRTNGEISQTRFYTCFAVAISATMGIAFSANLLTLFIFYEILTISTYPLVVHHGAAAMKGGRTYLGILLTASMGLLFPAMLVVWTLTGSFTFTRGGILSGTELETWQIGLLLAAFVYGLAKSAVMPLHRWLPAAMVAPVPVSALLHAVAVVKAGVVSLMLVVIYIFGVDFLRQKIAADWMAGEWLAYIACITIVGGSWIALKKDELKARLAYSTISHLSYIVLGIALLSPLSLVGGVIHIAAHAFAKITLFFAAGAITTQTGYKYVSQLNGVGRSMPWTFACFTIGSLSLIGVPLTLGFVSKWYLLLGAFDAHHYVAIAALTISTLLNAAYLLPIIVKGFFRVKDEEQAPVKEAPITMVAAMIIASLFTILLFFYSDWVVAIGSEIPSQWEPIHLK